MVCSRDSPFFLGTVQALIKAMGKTLNHLSCISWVNLHRCFLIMSLAFSTFAADWGLQEQCKWYSIPRALNTTWFTVVLKMEPLSFKIPFTSWEVSTVRFCPLVNLWALGISKTMEQFSSVQFSHSVMSDSLCPNGWQHTRSPCPLPNNRHYTNSCSLSCWCHPTISSSVVPFSCCQSFPASWSFQKSQLFASGDQSTGVSASASVFLMDIQDWSPLGWTGWISLQSKGLSRVFSNMPWS